MEDKELRERLSRIEKHLGMEPYDTCVTEKEPVKVQTVKIDRIGELLVFIEEKRKEAKEEAFLVYLKNMEETLCREQVRIDDYAANLYQNYEVYKKRHADAAPLQMQSSIEVNAEPVLVPKPISEPAPIPVQTKPVVPIQTKPVVPIQTKPAAKKDMEFGIGAVVLSIVGALFIIASLVIFGLNFMDNLQQGIFFYVLAGVVIAFSEFILRRHLERFAQAVTGIGVCVLYTATILNYLYLHTMNSVAALLVTVAISVFALLLSRKRESASLRLIGILGCYISLMPLDKFETQMEFIIPCAILLIVNVIYLLLPVRREDVAVRNVHAIANVVASGYLMVTAWISELSAGFIFAFVALMVVVHYAIYYKAKYEGSLKGVYMAGQILLHLLLAFIAWDEKFYAIAAVVLFLVHVADILLDRENRFGWVGLHCWTGFFLLVSTSMTEGAFLVGVSVVYVLYQVVARIWNEPMKLPNKVVALFSELVFLVNLQSDSNMQYVLLAVFVLSVVCIKYDKMFHEVLLLSGLWAFGLFGFDHLAIALPLSIVFLLLCMILFTRVELYRAEKVTTLITFVWIYNVISLIASLAELWDPNRISMTVVLLAESVLLMLLFSSASGTKEENIVKGRTHALVIFFTYMVFAFGIELPIAVSILLMLIAVSSVGVGFWLKIKSVRIYGLCMSLFVCGKLLLVDFAGAQSADRVISFLVVGVIALAISYLYMRIERSLAEKENL